MKLWQWPNGLVWQMTRDVTIQSRRKKFELFLSVFKPGSETTILDVGASSIASGERAENFLEEWYEYPEKITALLMGDVSAFAERYPKTQVQTGNGLHLPFEDKSFEIVFSNAVLEHVGDLEAQEQFVRECLRVGKHVFLTTPARGFPLESHTMIPFVHWLPHGPRNSIYRLLGRRNEGTPGYLTLLSARSLRKLFPRDVRVQIVKQHLCGLTSVLIAIV